MVRHPEISRRHLTSSDSICRPKLSLAPISIIFDAISISSHWLESTYQVWRPWKHFQKVFNYLYFPTQWCLVATGILILLSWWFVFRSTPSLIGHALSQLDLQIGRLTHPGQTTKPINMLFPFISPDVSGITMCDSTYGQVLTCLQNKINEERLNSIYIRACSSLGTSPSFSSRVVPHSCRWR